MNRHLRRPLILGTRHFRLLLRCFATVFVVRLFLTFSTYHPVSRAIEAIKPKRSFAGAPELLVWGVQRTSKLVPGATCLTQALAIRYLYARHGIDCTVRIGVAQKDGGQFDAHAWVLYQDRVIMGGTVEELARYTPLTDL